MANRAVEDAVSASTQKQALSALLFYQEVIQDRCRTETERGRVEERSTYS